MEGFIQRLSAVALCLALIGANGAVCAGWAPTPEARMACCVEEEHCPMHGGESHAAGDSRALTQAEADQCCAASERGPSSPSSTTVSVTLSSATLDAGILLPVSVPALVLSDHWRTVLPIPAAPVPKHLLLSVFLV